MKLKFALPAGLQNRKCERFDPAKMGGLPPIRFVPESTHDSDSGSKDDSKRRTVKIKINDNVTKQFDVFLEGGPESVIQLIRNHESIVDDTKLLKQYSDALAAINAKKTAIRELDPVRDNTKVDTLSAATAHQLLNNDGQADVNFAGAAREIGFTWWYFPNDYALADPGSRGLADGDWF